MNTTNTAKVIKQHKLTVALSVMVFILFCTNIYVYFFKEGTLIIAEEKLRLSNLELITVYTKLDSIDHQLVKKIDETEKIGGEVENLKKVRELLLKEKEDLVHSDYIMKRRYAQIKSNLYSYTEILNGKTNLISELQQVNQKLVEENLSLKEAQNELESKLETIEREKKELNAMVEKVKALSLEKFSISAVDKNGKIRNGEYFKQKQVSAIKIRFSFTPNELFDEQGKKAVFLRVVAPDGTVKYSPGASSKTFKFNESELFYTFKHDIQGGQELQSEKIVEYEFSNIPEKGTFAIEIYSDGLLIGLEKFTVS